MTGTKTSIVGIAVLLLAAAVVVWLMLSIGESDEHGRSGDNLNVSSGADPASGNREQPVPAVPTDRYTEPRPKQMPESAGHDASPRGAILVRVTWQETKEPAAAIGVLCYGFVEGRMVWLERVTGPRGQVEFTERRPGAYTIMLDRPATSSSVQVEAGKRSSVELQIPPGPDVDGIVVDAHGRPVAGADIVLSSGGTARKPLFVVGNSASDGTFHLRDLHAFNLVGARTSKHGTSNLQLLAPLVTGGKALVRLRIELPLGAGSVAGTVRDVTGNPLVAVAVAVGREDISGQRQAGGGVHMAPPPLRTRTDSDGRFSIEGIAEGDHTVLADRDGLAPHAGQVAISVGRTTTLDIRMQPAATLEGRVTDSRGEPLANGEVTITLPAPMRSRDATTAADGTYEIRNLPSGEFSARARHHPEGEVTTQVILVAGRATRWDAALVSGHRIRGIVVDHKGEAIAGWCVSADGHSKGAKTDTEGLFELGPFNDARARRLRVSSEWGFRPAELVVDEVRPGPELVRIEVPETARASAFITGTVVGPDGREVPTTTLDLEQSGYPVYDTPRPRPDGSFRIGPLPPGGYALSLLSRELPAIRVPPINLSAGEERDLGVLRFEAAGRLIVRLAAPSGFDLSHAVLSVNDEAGRRLQRGVVAGDRASFGPLPTRRLRLCVRGEGIAARMIPFVVVAGTTTTLDVALSEARSVTIRFPEAVSAAVTGGLRVTIANEVGESTFDGRLHRARDGTFSVRLSLPEGTYRVVGIADNGLRGETSLVIASGVGSEVSVPLR